ncbi:GIY-YIG nuclease family protein [Gramella sp. KN1008]|uniref:GIY-YIG nuclease family protein n=1 Tax=Gramella sp. KN1008 TaxID=2529298 RepID=UPI0010388451|nr:GIY-YIG nuclease family protein [Gramella sp. KN1008]TBW29042.1 GIY-YIG nuclease family protein [Gramella sp. KN1008]TBW29043.1 GIY-YIG nuclease family protein [Gramella sp. KN1008]
MAEFVTYVLYSKKFDKIYIGYTSSLIQRFSSHNHFAKKGFTIKYRPWKVILVEFNNTKADSIKREKFLKSGQGRSFIRREILPFYK